MAKRQSPVHSEATETAGHAQNDIRQLHLADAVRMHLRQTLGLAWDEAGPNALYRAFALAVHERLVGRMVETRECAIDRQAKRLFHLSTEYIFGKMLQASLQALGLEDVCLAVMESMGLDSRALFSAEQAINLGNNSQAVIAADILESVATREYFAVGYGLLYEFGPPRQEIKDGGQREMPGLWEESASPWLVERPEDACLVPLYGRVEEGFDRHGNYCPRWVDWKVVVGVPFDMPVAGCKGTTVNTVRFFSARPSHDFDSEFFTNADYLHAIEEKIELSNLSKLLIPADAFAAARERLFLQQYFLAACAIHDVIRQYKTHYETFEHFTHFAAIHLNGTASVIAIPELMRVLVDEHNVPWDTAWSITTATVSSTTYEHLKDLSDCYSVSMMERILPRHLQILFEINRRFLDDVRLRWSCDIERLSRMSFFQEGEDKQLRLRHVAFTCSHAVTGASRGHSRPLSEDVITDFCEMFPERYCEVDLGVSIRRWLQTANRPLAKVLTTALGDDWARDPAILRGLERLESDTGFVDVYHAAHVEAKSHLARTVRETLQLSVDPDALFDVQATRMHECKRQLLHAMHIIHEYILLVDDGMEPAVPRVHLFAGKAAPGYWAAKQNIRLLHQIAATVNADPRTKGLIAVAFLPDYGPSLAEKLFAAADLNEHISTAGTESTALGAIKAGLNGALLITAPDNPSADIAAAIGSDISFVFGCTVPELRHFEASFGYSAISWYERDQRVRRVMDAIHDDRFSPDAPGTLDWVWNVLLHGGDKYFHLADLSSYLDCQASISDAYRDAARWRKMSIRTVARVAQFANDGAVEELAQSIWKMRRLRL